MLSHSFESEAFCVTHKVRRSDRERSHNETGSVAFLLAAHFEVYSSAGT